MKYHYSLSIALPRYENTLAAPIHDGFAFVSVASVALEWNQEEPEVRELSSGSQAAELTKISAISLRRR